jgi:hypothetical protein
MSLRFRATAASPVNAMRLMDWPAATMSASSMPDWCSWMYCFLLPQLVGKLPHGLVHPPNGQGQLLLDFFQVFAFFLLRYVHPSTAR